MRLDDCNIRKENEMRPVSIEKGFMPYAEGSALICCGNTKVICTATVEQGTPGFMEEGEGGWLTAEYSMLPRATQTRNSRQSQKPRLFCRRPRFDQCITQKIGRILRRNDNIRKITQGFYNPAFALRLLVQHFLQFLNFISVARCQQNFHRSSAFLLIIIYFYAYVYRTKFCKS